MSTLKTGALRGTSGSADTMTLHASDGSVEIPKLKVGSDAAGDVLYHNGTNYVRLAKGTDGQVLTLASGVPTWSSPAGGKILQVVHATYATETGSGSGTTEVTTGLTLNITPAATGSKVFINFRLANCRRQGHANAYGRVKLYRGDNTWGSGTQTSIYQSSNGWGYHTPAGTYTLDVGDCGGTWVDAPSSTSAVTYTVTMQNIDTNGEVKWSTNNSTSSIVAMEIAA